jgi:tripartite-type tricarboxylate transporter receptor subunit TctC
MKIAVFSTVAALALFAGPALAQDYPDHEIQGVIQWGAGGATDTVSRAMQPLAEEKLGEKIVMTNRTGGTGVIGMRYVQSRPDDGYTLLFGAENPQIYKVLGLADSDYADFYPVNIPARGVVVVTVPADSEFETMQDLLTFAQEQPGELRMGSAGHGSLTSVVEAMIKSATEFETTSVPFDGEGPGLTAMLGNAVDFMPAGLSAAKPLIESGRARALAVINAEPIEQLPDVPPITDTLPDVEKFLPWGPFYGVFVSDEAPEEAKTVLTEAFSEAVQSEAFVDMMQNRGNIMMNLSGEEARAFLTDWQSTTAWLLDDAGVTEASPEEFGIPRP